MNREDLEVGKVYVNDIEEERLILAIGDSQVFVKDLFHGNEFTINIAYVLEHYKPKPKERKTITLTEHITDGSVRFLTDDLKFVYCIGKTLTKLKELKGDYHIIKAPNARTITLDAETFEVVE